MKNKKIKVLVATLFWLIMWQLLSMIINKGILFPSPIVVIKHLWQLAFTTDFWKSIYNSAQKIAIGFLLSMFVGSLLGVLVFRYKTFDYLFKPILYILKSIPVASITMLLLFYLKSSILPIAISFLIVMPIFLENIKNGLNETDKNLLEMAEIFNFSIINKIKHIYIPTIVPYFFSAVEVGIGFAWKSAISAEIIVYPTHTIGKMINNSKVYLDTPGLFSWTIVIIVFSAVFEFLIKLFIKRSGVKNGN